MPYSIRSIPAQVVGRLKYNLKNFMQHANRTASLDPEDVANLQKLCDLLLVAAQTPIDYDDDGTRISKPIGQLTECDVYGHKAIGQRLYCEACGIPML